MDNPASANVENLVDDEPVGSKLSPVLDDPFTPAFVDRVLRVTCPP